MEAGFYEIVIEQLEEWLLSKGKNPDNLEGYAPSTVQKKISRIKNFYYWVWENEGFTVDPRPEIADEYIRELARDNITRQDGTPYGEDSKRKIANALQSLYRKRSSQEMQEEWHPPKTFRASSYNSPDFFDDQERRTLRDEVLSYKTLPAYGDVSPCERERIKRELAQRKGIPKDEITPADWDENKTSYKIPSLIYVALDIGIRPSEVEKASVDWVRSEENQLVIPKEESAKNNSQWRVYIQDHTATLLDKWLSEREAYPKYDDSNRLWLNREGNPYSSQNLNPLVRNLCEHAGISTTNRKIVWYSFRHSLATYYADQTNNLEEVRTQMRHEDIESTLHYIHELPEKKKQSIQQLD